MKSLNPKLIKLLFASMAATVGSSALFYSGDAFAQQGDASGNVFCRRDGTVSIAEYPKKTVPDGYSDLKTYELNTDFRSPSNDIPWSQSKIFNDPVIGAYPGVLDRNYIPGASRIHTVWYRDLIIAEGLEISPYFFKRYQFDVLMIPAGDKYLVLRGCNGRFPVDSKVAAVLSSMPKDKEVYVKLYTPEFSGSILNRIGPGTVNAWKKVYANWTKSSTPGPQELGF